MAAFQLRDSRPRFNTEEAAVNNNKHYDARASMTDSFELKFGSDEESIGAIVALQRGLILTGYANVEFVLSDFLIRCSNIGFYNEIVPEKFPYPIEKRLKCLRSILVSPGPFQKYQIGLLSLVDQLVDFEDLRHMMSHGMLVLQYNKLDPGESRVIFKRYDVGRDRTLVLHNADLSLESFCKKQLDVTKYSHEVVRLMWQILEESRLPPPPMTP